MLAIISQVSDPVKRIKLETIYSNYSSMMYRVANGILKDEYLAQDAVQEAFINITKNYDKFFHSDCNKIRTLLVIITRNASIDIYRKRSKQLTIPFEEYMEEINDSSVNIEEIIISNETFTFVKDNISKLYPPFADILTLKYFYHYENNDISKILNITPENTRTRLHRARQSLIKLLSKEQEVVRYENA